jgi:hypothetical protein
MCRWRRGCSTHSSDAWQYDLPVPGFSADGSYGNHDRDGGDADAARMTLPRRRSGVRLRTGPCRALGADTPRDAELRGDLACCGLGSERKYMKRIYARDTGNARRQFAR